MDLRETAVILAYIATAFPAFRVSKETIQTWHEVLEGFDACEIKTAVKNFMFTSQSEYAPSIPQVIGELNKIKNSHQETALEAFSALQQGFKMRPEVRPQLGTKRAQRALQIIGGWSRFKEITDEELPYFKNDFVSAFNSLTERETFQELSSPEAKALLNKINEANSPTTIGCAPTTLDNGEGKLRAQAEAARSADISRNNHGGNLRELRPRVAGTEKTGG